MFKQHSILVTTLIAVILAALTGCAKDYSTNSYGTNPPPTTAPNTVVMSGTSFTPTTLTVDAGTMVTWKNQDSYLHTSTRDSGVWDTGDVNGGGGTTTTFYTPGTNTFHCTYHGAMGMTGTVVVR